MNEEFVSRTEPVPDSELRQRIDQAQHVAWCYGSIDGDHHKMWVIDQMVRALLGDDYDEWVRQHNEGKDGPSTHSWGTGIAP